jgi:hypothetical protein
MTEPNPIAGGVISRGYRGVGIDGQRYLEHRLVWFYVHGVWPADQIDHINGDRSDNRISNLREASQSQNNGNCRKRGNNVSGYTGVFWNTRHAKWQAQIAMNGRNNYIGLFSDIEEAVAARKAAAKRIHGDFARLE